MADFVPAVDDHVVTALAAAGTISVGKTNTPEFGFPCYTDNDLVGPARCPWDPSRLAGGSSGGAAVAVAAGMVPFAQGSDGGGSIRIPASINGLFGVKPTRGRISNAPYGGDVTGLGTNGPLARTVRDAAAMLDAMAGPVLGDPAWAPPLPPGESFLGWADRPPGRLRIGRWLQSPMPDIELDPEVVRGVRGRGAAARGPRPPGGRRPSRPARPGRAARVRGGVGAVRHDPAGTAGAGR